MTPPLLGGDLPLNSLSRIPQTRCAFCVFDEERVRPKRRARPPRKEGALRVEEKERKEKKRKEKGFDDAAHLGLDKIVVVIVVDSLHQFEEEEEEEEEER